MSMSMETQTINKHFKRESKLMYWIFLAPLILGFLVAIVYPNISGILGLNLCASNPLYQQTSPNGKVEAIVFNYDCGATTGFSTQVSLLPSGKAIDGPGNVLVTDGKNRIKVKWLSNSEVVIRNTKGLKTYKQLSNYNGVIINYQ